MPFMDLDKNKVFLDTDAFDLIPHRSLQPFEWQQIYQLGSQQVGNSLKTVGSSYEKKKNPKEKDTSS